MAGRAVPEAAERERNEGVQAPPGPALPAAAERDVDVVADPEAERDVPADPEILQVARRIGPVEVLRKADAEYPGAADRDVAVAPGIPARQSAAGSNRCRRSTGPRSGPSWRSRGPRGPGPRPGRPTRTASAPPPRGTAGTARSA